MLKIIVAKLYTDSVHEIAEIRDEMKNTATEQVNKKKSFRMTQGFAE